MDIGKMRHRVTIQSPSSTQDSYGQPTVTWTDAATVWARIETLAAREAEVAQRIYPTAEHKVTMRYRSGVTSDCRLKFGNRYLNVLSVQNPEQRNVDLVAICGEAV